ncbi:hypothetical protein [Enterococcus faecium]|uniref:hypothetical protein n=1 Tax=Enterococcus faecium TaxID=1352 RepID=UPI0022F1D77E|nr:hypothetical protein [Enterococcus faecium]MDQ8528134.1 hypothetical protein [Enterococcus faecium]
MAFLFVSLNYTNGVIKEMLFDQLLFGISSKQNGKVYGATLPFCFSSTQVSL